MALIVIHNSFIYFLSACFQFHLSTGKILLWLEYGRVRNVVLFLGIIYIFSSCELCIKTEEVIIDQLGTYGRLVFSIFLFFFHLFCSYRTPLFSCRFIIVIFFQSETKFARISVVTLFTNRFQINLIELSFDGHLLIAR